VILDALGGMGNKPQMDDGGAITPQAIVTLAYSLAALIAIIGGFAWFRFLNRRSAQSNAGKTPDMDGLSNAATATGLSMILAGAAYIFSVWF